MREDWRPLAAASVPPMVLQTGLSAGVVAALVLTSPGFHVGGVRAEERINWLKNSAKATAPLQAPAVAILAKSAAADLPLSLGTRGQACHLCVQDRGL